MAKRILIGSGVALAAMLAGTAPAAFIINEIDSDTPTLPSNDSAEFIELKGTNGEVATGLTLVFFNGSNTLSYQAYDLTGAADANGYYVVGNPGVPNVGPVTFPANTLQNGEDAVALYTGTSAAAFPTGTALTTTGLVDYVVYETGPDTDAVWTGLAATWTVYDENGLGQGADQSLARNPNGSSASPFEPQTPTPGADNVAITTPELTVNVSAINFGAFNSTGTATRTVTLTNTGGGTLNVTDFDLQAGSNAAYTISAGPTPPLNAALTAGQSVQLTVQFEIASAPGSDTTYTGAVEYTTDAPSNGTGTVPLTAQFVTIVNPAVAGAVVINEISYDPLPPTPATAQDYNGDGTASTTDDEFVELYNTTGSPIDIKGWELQTSNNATVETLVIPQSVVIPAGGVVVFFGGGTPTGFSGNAYTGGTSLANGGEVVVIGDGTTISDQVSYLTPSSVDFPTPTEAGVTSDGGSIGRFPDGTATFVEFTWDGSTSNPLPSPGELNAGAPPASATSWDLYQ